MKYFFKIIRYFRIHQLDNSFFQTLHAGHLFVIFSPIFFKNTLPQLLQALKLSDVIMLLLHLPCLSTSVFFEYGLIRVNDEIIL